MSHFFKRFSIFSDPYQNEEFLQAKSSGNEILLE